ncbi:PKD domain-containing protein [Pendulispora brunnea]|uniref:PKD domain-containing protein n=1 Tax=Pendulispora brunnea TaxID=2905690 RepID=A0ABZ2JUP8_9BACT
MPVHVRPVSILAALLSLALPACSSDEPSIGISQPGPSNPSSDPTLRPPPTLEILMSRPSPLVNEKVILTVTSSSGGPLTSARWNFGDGQSGEGTSTEHRWMTASPPSYLVSVTVRTSDGQQGTASKSVTVQSE